jgi:hypothetical protein
MHITRDNVEALCAAVEELRDDLDSFTDPAEVWLDEETTDPDERRDAREDMQDGLDSVEGHLLDVLALVMPDAKRLLGL